MNAATQQNFERYHHIYPRVYDLFVKYARIVKATGLKKYSIWAVGNRVRWHYQFEVSKAEAFKISNDFFALYARLIMEQEADLRGFFTIKRLKNEDVSE